MYFIIIIFLVWWIY